MGSTDFDKAYFNLIHTIPPVEKNRTGHKYKYSDLHEVITKISGPLKSNGFVLFHQLFYHDGQLNLTTVLRHASGEQLTSVWPVEPSGNEPNKAQAVGSLITYGRRYNISCLLNLDSIEDDDAGSTGHEYQPRKQSSAPAVAGLTDNQQNMVRAIVKKRNILASDVIGYSKETFNKSHPREWTTKELNIWLEFMGEK